MAGGSVAKTVNGKGNTTRDIVAKLWNLCNVLRDDGITYTDYVTELTFLLFLKMLAETGHEERLPKAYRWEKLDHGEGLDQLEYYRRLLLDLGNPKITKDPVVLSIFTDAQTKLRKPTNLKALTDAIDKLDWFSAREEGLGNLYEGLLEKNASEKKSGAGQYFTPRPLIDCIIRLLKPQPGELIQDPAAGTGGFLVAADHYIKNQTDNLYKLSAKDGFFQRHNAFVGLELVPDTCVIVGSLDHNNLYLSDKVLRIRFNQPVEQWVLHYLRSKDGRTQIENLSTGNQLSMRNISQAAIKAIRIPLPSIDVRNRVSDRINKALASIECILGETDRASRLVDRLNQAALAKAFRGELTGVN